MNWNNCSNFQTKHNQICVCPAAHYDVYIQRYNYFMFKFNLKIMMLFEMIFLSSLL